MSSTTPETPFRFPDVMICYVEIPTSDIQTCKDFYATVFPSWSFTANGDEWGFEGLSGLIGTIVQAPPGHQSEIDQMIQMGGEALVATISQRVESVDETRQRVEQLGGEARSPKERGRDGYYYMLFKDRDGNRFSVYERS
ncbi:hypothetical protein V8E51_007671 [Hyaloscypha variabilis]